jgi:hypothetical protein
MRCLELYRQWGTAGIARMNAAKIPVRRAIKTRDRMPAAPVILQSPLSQFGRTILPPIVTVPRVLRVP